MYLAESCAGCAAAADFYFAPPPPSFSSQRADAADYRSARRFFPIIPKFAVNVFCIIKIRLNVAVPESTFIETILERIDYENISSVVDQVLILISKTDSYPVITIDSIACLVIKGGEDICLR